MNRHLTAPVRVRSTATSRSAGGWRADPFELQRGFLRDDARRKALLCGRRAGKTEALAYWLIDGALNSPGEQSLYIALSRPICRRLLWTTMQRIQRRHPELPFMLREVDNQLVARFSNAHDIWLAGCKDRASIDNFRGPRYRRAAIDEAGTFGDYLGELVEEVIEPALMDLDGEVAMSGTPGPLPQGYFHQATTGEGGPRWSVHSWTAHVNPYMQPPYRKTTVEEWLKRKCEENGWDEKHPRYVREYLGQWITDLGALVFPFDRARNGYWDLPAPPTDKEYTTGTAMDFGFVDSTAWVAGQWVRGLPTLWLRESESVSGLIPSAVAVRTERWRERWQGRLIGDAGGIGKAYMEEMIQRFHVPISPAQKHDKRVAIEYMRGDLMAGTVQVDLANCRSLIDEWSRIQWDEKHTGIDKDCIDHEAHAALYLHREVRLTYRPEEEPPEPGSPEAARAEMDRLREKRAREQRQRRREESRRW